MSSTPTGRDGLEPEQPAGDILEEIKAEIEHELEEERPPHAGPTTQVVAGLVALAAGVFGIVQSLGYGLGEATQPGPGLWPFIVSLVITVLAVMLLAVGRHDTDTEQFTRSSLLTAVGVVTLIALAVLVPVIGFEIPSVLMMFVWLKLLGGESWRSTVLVSVLTVAAFYALFILGLGIPLPHLI